MKRFLTKMLWVLIIIVLCAATYSVNAKDLWETSEKFLETGSDKIGMLEEFSKLLQLENITKGKFEELIDFIWAIGLLVVFVSTVILGIKYMFVLPQEKSRLKQATTPYIIGVVIIFGALTIWKLVINVLDGSL